MVEAGCNIAARFLRLLPPSTRPPWVWPEVWKDNGQKRRDELAIDWELVQKRLKTARAKAQDVPAMPCRPYVAAHRDRLPELEFPFFAAVARPVGKAEIRSNPKAEAALVK